MADATLTLLYDKNLFPALDADTVRLLNGALEQGGLLISDLHALRDLLELSAYLDRPAAYALVLALMMALEDGSLCVEVNDLALTRRLGQLVDGDGPAWARRILAELDGPGLPKLIGAANDTGRPLLLHEHKGRRFLYFQKYLRCEQAFYQSFLERLRLPPPALPAKLPEMIREVLHERPVHVAGKSMVLDVNQQAAVGLGLLQNLVLISGGPGTGKTSIVFTLLRCQARLGITPDRMALAAPTGRAAQRLGDALEANFAALGNRATAADEALRSVKPTTLHQLLGYVPATGQFRRHQENPVAADLVVVDEVSMVSIELMAGLLQALAPATRLILLGDKDQLPSVEAGAVLAHLLPRQAQHGFSPHVGRLLTTWFGGNAWPEGAASPLGDHVAILRTNHRSQPLIQEAAQAINQQDETLAERLPALLGPARDVPWEDLSRRGGCWLWPPPSPHPAELRKILDSWAHHAFLDRDNAGSYADDLADCTLGPEDVAVGALPALDRLFARMERFRLLALLREGPWGVTEINRYLAHQVRTRLDRQALGAVFAGAPVLITRTDHNRQLVNGDVGLTLRGRDGGRRVVFRRRDQFISFPAESLPPHELGFALTVHKSQGSEYDEVLLVLPPEAARRLLTKELIYTAVTRAKHLAILCGSQETLKFALRHQIVREAGLLRF